jgi:uncharacterized protein
MRKKAVMMCIISDFQKNINFGIMNRREFFKLTIGSTLAIVAGGSIDAFGIEPYSIEVTTFQPFPNKSGNTGSTIKIAYMSDFHRSSATPREIIQKAVKLCQLQNPDIILLGGDYITKEANLTIECAEDLSALKANDGIYYVLGNHDYWHGAKIVNQALNKEGFINLTNANTKINENFSLCGIDDIWAGKPDSKKAFKGTDGRHKLVFSHNPRIFPRIKNHNCVLICGHTHGGQINIPFFPNPYMHSWDTYIKGWFYEGNSKMYVNRGIGMLELPFRFRCRPEITVFTISK